MFSYTTKEGVPKDTPSCNLYRRYLLLRKIDGLMPDN